MPYYIEYFTRPEDVPLDEFHTKVKAFYDGWAAAHPEDELVLMLGRTWRLGPRPAHLSVWRFRDFARFDDWKAQLERYRAEQGHRGGEPFMVVEKAGVYEDLGEEIL